MKRNPLHGKWPIPSRPSYNRGIWKTEKDKFQFVALFSAEGAYLPPGVLQSAANLLIFMIAGGNHTLIHRWIFRSDEGGTKKTDEERRDVGHCRKPATTQKM